jgi:hypothetical protein
LYASATGTLHPRYWRRNRAPTDFVRPRYYRIRAALVEAFLFAILIDMRNGPVPQTRSWLPRTP